MGRRFGVNLAQPHAAVVATYDGADRRMWQTAASWLDTPVRVDRGRAWTLATGDVHQRVTVIQARLQEFVSDGAVRVAAGPVGVGAEPLRSGFRLAGIVLGLSARRGGPAATTDPSRTAVAEDDRRRLAGARDRDGDPRGPGRTRRDRVRDRR